MKEFIKALSEQSAEIRAALMTEIETGRYQLIENEAGKELSVFEIVETQFFQENDLAEKFTSDNVSIEELRDLQRDEIAKLSDIIEENEVFRLSVRDSV